MKDGMRPTVVTSPLTSPRAAAARSATISAIQRSIPWFAASSAISNEQKP